MLSFLKDIFLSDANTLDRDRFFIGLMILAQLVMAEMASGNMINSFYFALYDNSGGLPSEPVLFYFVNSFSASVAIGDIFLLAGAYLLARGVAGPRAGVLLAIVSLFLMKIPLFMSSAMAGWTEVSDLEQFFMLVILVAPAIVSLIALVWFIVIWFRTPSLSQQIPDHPLLQIRTDVAAEKQLTAVGYLYRTMAVSAVLMALMCLLFMIGIPSGMADGTLIFPALILLAGGGYLLVLVVRRLRNAGIRIAGYLALYLLLVILILAAKAVFDSNSLFGSVWLGYVLLIISGISQAALLWMNLLLLKPADQAMSGVPATSPSPLAEQPAG